MRAWLYSCIDKTAVGIFPTAIQGVEKPLPQQIRVKGEAIVGCRGKTPARRRPCVTKLSAQAPRAPEAQFGAA